MYKQNIREIRHIHLHVETKHTRLTQNIMLRP